MTGPTPVVRRLMALPADERAIALETILDTELDLQNEDLPQRLTELLGCPGPVNVTGRDSANKLASYLLDEVLTGLTRHARTPARRPVLWDVVMLNVG